MDCGHLQAFWKNPAATEQSEGKKLAVCLVGLMSTRLSRDVTAHCIYQIPKENVSTDLIYSFGPIWTSVIKSTPKSH